jgi:recombinational DNA repair protein (RecF pathway)
METDLYDKLTPGRFSTNIHHCAGCGVQVYRNMRKPGVGQFRCMDCKLKNARDNQTRIRAEKKALLLAKKGID